MIVFEPMKTRGEKAKSNQNNPSRRWARTLLNPVEEVSEIESKSEGLDFYK